MCGFLPNKDLNGSFLSLSLGVSGSCEGSVVAEISSTSSSNSLHWEEQVHMHDVVICGQLLTAGCSVVLGSASWCKLNWY